jgi:glycyl-tRNA synthetase
MTQVEAATKTPEQLKDELDALNAEVTKQGAHVRQLKKDGAEADMIGEAVQRLQTLKLQASTLSEHLQSDQPTFNRKAFDDLVIRKMFIVSSFEIHGGVKGLFDLGPPACALKVRSTPDPFTIFVECRGY